MAVAIYKRGTIYWMQGAIDGQRIRQTLSTRNRAVAIKRAADLELQIDSDLRPIPWPEMRKRFVANYIGRTAADYRRLIQSIERHWPSKIYPHEVTLLELEEFVQRSIRKANTIRHEVALLRSIWGWAYKRRIVAANIARDLHMPRLELGATMPFKPSELVAMEKAIHSLLLLPSLIGQGAARTIHNRTWAMYQLFRTTGIRLSDLIRLRPENFVDAHLVFQTRKTKNYVRIAVVEEVRIAMEALVVPPSGYYFWSGRSAQSCIIGVGRTFRNLGKRAGVPHVHPHRFRDTFAVTLLASGADIRLVSRLLGHRTLRATERHYSPWIKVFQDQADAAVYGAERYSIERRSGGIEADRDFESAEETPFQGLHHHPTLQ